MEAIVILSGVLLIVALISLLYVESYNQTLKTKLDVAEDNVEFMNGMYKLSKGSMGYLREQLDEAKNIIELHEKEFVYYDRITNEIFTSPMIPKYIRPDAVIIGEL